VNGQLEHKLSDTPWWVIVVAERLGIDTTEAYAGTTDRIERGLASAVATPPP
jgi:hypothetical protein